jgi:hypothetical protein
MNKFSQLYENNNEKTLLIVDVQQQFQQWIPKGFIDGLINYCKNFTDVYQIWDSNKAAFPSYKFPNEKGVYEKKYGITFSKDLNNVCDELLKQYPETKEGDIFKFKDTKSIVIRVKNNHKWFYVNEPLVKFLKIMKGKNVILVGGAMQECLKDVEEALEYFGIKYEINNKFIYSAETSNKDNLKDL